MSREIKDQLRNILSHAMSYLKDRVVIITGASGGIGGATAVEFAAVGACLCLTGRNEERLNATKQKCIEAGLSDKNIITVIADVTKHEELLQIVTKTVDKFKQIDVLVNNAGAGRVGSFEDIAVDYLDQQYNLSARSAFSLSKAALPYLIKSKGNIVNVSSIAGQRPMHLNFAYAAGKAMLDHMTKMMAVELGPKGVRVNSVCPGVIKTDMMIAPGGPMHHTPEKLSELYESVATAHPMQKVGDPPEVAKMILFLASQAASFISGAIIPIDGAWSCTVGGASKPMDL